MTSIQYNTTINNIFNNNASNKYEYCVANINSSLSYLYNGCDKLELGMILGQRHGGTNWFLSKLSEYRQMYIESERLLDWQYDHCSIFAKYYVFKNDCDSPQIFIDAMDAVNAAFFKKKSDRLCSDRINRTYFYFWKIQIDQIPPALFKTFVDYVYCNNITVIQLIRSATIASFWSYQAEGIERTQSLNLDRIIHKRANDLEKIKRVSEIKLDPYLARKYVMNIDTNRQYLAKLFKLFPETVKFEQFYYEDLISTYSKKYWKSILAFIGDIDTNHRRNDTRKIHREHPKPCYKKITNWLEVKQHLNGTDSYFACEKTHS